LCGDEAGLPSQIEIQIWLGLRFGLANELGTLSGMARGQE